MKTLGIAFAGSSLILLLVQSLKVLTGSEPVTSADVMVMSASLSFLSTAFIAMGTVFSKGD